MFLKENKYYMVKFNPLILPLWKYGNNLPWNYQLFYIVLLPFVKNSIALFWILIPVSEQKLYKGKYSLYEVIAITAHADVQFKFKKTKKWYKFIYFI